MYQRHFAFTSYPFDTALPPDALFESAAVQQASLRIQHLLELRGIGLLTGEAGSGKTTVCRWAMNALPVNRYRVCYVALSTGSVLDGYNMIAAALGLERYGRRSTAYQAIRHAVSRLVSDTKQYPILIFDEAHHLQPELLEELRLLTNYEMDSVNRLCLLLVGLTDLRQRLAMAVHASLSQRIVLRCTLDGLARDEVGPYVAHRLRRVGAESEIFDATAVEALALASNGLPRRIDRLAHYALHAAALERSRTVSADHVQTAMHEMSQ